MKSLKRILSLALVLCLVLSIVPVSALAVESTTTTSDKPADGTTSDQPFPTNIGVGHYRIPAIVTLDNGTLVAAADARWKEHTSSADDSGDIDTIVSVSKDNGKTWSYTFANYIYGGNISGTANYNAATIIDPALATDGETVYMIADLFPAIGVKSQSSTQANAGDGFDDNRHMLLAKTSSTVTAESQCAYYLNEGKIYSINGNQDQGYTVDAWFNVTKDGVSYGNLFNCGDYNTSGFRPLMTSYLFLTKSTDGGENWSDPQMLNFGLKDNTAITDSALLVSPGRGLVTSDGTIVVGVYGFVYDSSYKWNTGIIYSKDGGANWTRLSDAPSGARGESEIVELADGTLRMFYRCNADDGKLPYVDITKQSDGTYAWGKNGTAVASGNAYGQVNLSAITYSKKTTDGKQLILVSDAGSTSGRYNGKIFAFTVDSSNNMTLVSTYEVTGSGVAFSYSSMTEQKDGSIGILYENGDSGNITYKNLDIDTITGGKVTLKADPSDTAENATSGITVGVSGEILNPALSVSKVETVAGLSGSYVAYNITPKLVNGESYSGNAVVTLPVPSELKGKYIRGFVVNSDGSITYCDVTYSENGNSVSFPVTHFSVMGLVAVQVSDSIGDNTEKNVPLYVGGSVTIKDETGDHASNWDSTELDQTIAKVEVSGKTVEASTKTEKVASLSANDTVILGNGTQWIKLSGTTIKMTTDPADATQWTVEKSDSSWKFKSGGYYLGHSGDTLSASTSTRNSTWSYSSSNGIYYTSKRTTYYLTCNSGWTLKTSASSYAHAYTVTTTTTEKQHYTTITITGVGEGTTSVVVGNTKYIINVTYKNQTVKVYKGMTKTVTLEGTVTDEQIAAFNETYGSIVTVKKSGDDLVFTGVNTGVVGSAVLGNVEYTVTVEELPDMILGGTGDTDAFFLGGSTQYNSSVTSTASNQNYASQGKAVTGLVITTGTSFDLDFNADLSGSPIASWGVTSNKITVDQDGVVTGVTATEDDEKIYVIVTCENGLTYGIPVIVEQFVDDYRSTTYFRTLDMYNSIEYNCTAYYSYRLGSLKELPQGTQVFVQQDFENQQDMITFFATPDDGYALTYVNGTEGQYFQRVRNSDGTGWGSINEGDDDTITSRPSGGYIYLHDQLVSFAYNNSIVLDGTKETFGVKMHAMLNEAVEKKCDGAFFWTRSISTYYGKSMQSELKFIAEKLPEIQKVLTGVTHEGNYTAYTKGMTISIGDTLHYTLYVCVPQVHYTESGCIDYTSFTLTDPLTGHEWLAETLRSNLIELGDNASDEEKALNVVSEGSFEFFINSDSQGNKECTLYDNVYAFADVWTKQANADGKVVYFENSSFEYYNSNGEKVTYNGSNSYIYAFATSLTLSRDNYLDVVKDGKVVNTADLEYIYQGTYSKGTTGHKSNVEIGVKIETPEYVVDFGYALEIKMGHIPTGASIVFVEDGKYGKAYITGENTILYVPDSILQDDDFIRMAVSDGTTDTVLSGYGVWIYPASTVYYEEGFINWNQKDNKDVWTVGTTSGGQNITYYEYPNWKNQDLETINKKTLENVVVQKTERLGNSGNYGYDDAYKSNTGASNGTDASTSVMGANGTFTFTGTGFDLHANCNESSGTVTVKIKDTQGKILKMYMVDTVVAAGGSLATSGQSGELKGLPILTYHGLEYGTYTVEIRKIYNDDKSVYIDGVRIYGTVQDSSIYAGDQEQNPQFEELRDHVLNAIGVKDSNQYGSLENIVDQVYNSTVGQSALILDEKVVYANSETAQDLLDNGPKNELYLYGGQTLTFKVKTSGVLQLGLKAPQGATKVTITVNGNELLDLSDISSSVDMFYKLANAEGTYTVTVTNDGSNILSVTQLKICGVGAATESTALQALTEEDVAYALRAIGCIDEDNTTEPEAPVIPEEPEIVYADAIVNIDLVDHIGKSLASVQLNDNGISGEKVTFSAKEILEKVAAQIPEKYALVDASAVLDLEICYGETHNGSVQIGKVTTLTINYVNIFGRKTGSVTLTKIQTAAGLCKFTASEIKAGASGKRKVLWLTNLYVPYGSDRSITVVAY